MDSNSTPFDTPTLNYRIPNLSSSGQNSSSNVASYNGGPLLSSPLERVNAFTPPPIPPRPVRNNYSSNFSAFSSPYNSYLHGGYSPSLNNFGTFGNYGGYGTYGFNNYRPGFGLYHSSYPENRFIQFAEESSRPAFQSIQSLLHALGSVTAMFESSFHAIYSSYMSVLGVADNFSRLRSAFGQIFSTFAIIKTLNWIYKKLLYILGINREYFAKEAVWSDALKQVSKLDEKNKGNKRKSWPVIVFMSIMIGGPYLLFKLMSELQPSSAKEVWKPEQQPGPLAIGLYDFHAASENELSINAQQKFMIAPKNFQPTDSPGWVLACNENRKIGLIPHNYIGMLMQSEKTGQTYIECNGQTYLQKNSNKNFPQKVMKSNENEENATSVEKDVVESTVRD